jgi:glycosyltransferase involved in cell wall biosynthesis
MVNNLDNTIKNILLVGNHFSDAQHNPNVSDDLAFHLRAVGHHVLTTSGKHNKMLRLVDMLSTILRNQQDYQLAQVDVFSGQAFTWAFLSVKLLRRLKKPVILTLHGGNLPEFAQQHSKIVRELLSLADAVTAPSNYLLESMHQYRDDIILISNALEISKYTFIHRKKPKPILVWLRAFHEIYHPEMAIEVLKQLKDEFPHVKLIMTGPDKGDGSLQKTQDLAVQFNLQDHVSFPGATSKPDVPARLHEGDIFLNTTNFDNTPISVMEAMASGLSIVSTNVGGLPYLLEDGIDVLLVPPNDPDVMAAAVKRILTEPGLAENLSANARKKAEQFDWSKILPQWEKLFEEISSHG